MGMRAREQRLESFDGLCWVGNFLNKIFSPEGLGESPAFNMVGRLRDETSST